MLTVIAFIVALGVLIAIHEYGHYRVAVACGVKVLRFSIGIGKPLLRWKGKHSETEFVLAALPLGGYVRMLDGREGDVPEHERHRAFNHQPLRSRAAIVVAGPLANLLLAVVLYSIVNWVGMQEPKAVLSAPAAQTLASEAGIRGGEEVLALQLGTHAVREHPSFEDVRWAITKGMVDRLDVHLTLQTSAGVQQQVRLPLSQRADGEVDPAALAQVGITQPWSAPVIGDVMAGMPAQQAGLQAGDVVLRVADTPVRDAAQLRQWIRQWPQHAAAGAASVWWIERAGAMLELPVQPAIETTEDGQVGKVGAYIGAMPAMMLVQKGPLEGVQAGIAKTWEVSKMSVQMLWRMLTGQASIKNLSGPLTIADYAGKSASVGLLQYVLFVALISVSLGVLNLLPVPVLDGGHLMYYLWEGVTGHPVNDVWMERLQRVGIGLLLVMMSIAFFNDISRIWG